MVSSNDLRRLLNGLSLVALELAKRSPRGPDPVASSPLKAAADVVGITRGKVQAYSATKRRMRTESVVYFPETTKEADLVTDAVPSHPDSANTLAEGSAGTEFSSWEEKEAVVGLNDVRASVEGSETGAEKVNEGESKRSVDGEEAIGEDNSGKVGQAAAINRKLRERRVPSTPFSRALGFAGLGVGLAWGTLQESARRLAFGSSTGEDGQSALSPFLSESNAERLALALCRMRGAALKIGQMLSIQDEALIPAPILSALEIVRQGADVMPRSQLNRVLDDELGNDWTSKLQNFDYEPLAAASIGQVHKAVTRDGKEVAVKIQYPGVADSIDSDIENVRRLLDYTNLIPEGLYLDRAIKVAKDELSRECNYEMEAANQRRFRELLHGADGFYVPKVIDNLCSRRVLTTELVSGIPIDAVANLDQPTRNYVGQKLLEITLKELFVFRFMQTDPNWGNFLYDEPKKIVNLIDFGAARDYPKEFVDNYLRMVLACANSDRDAILEMSRRLGFLTGEESEEMLEAHIQAALIVGLPFSLSGGYDFRSSNITRSVSNLGTTMLKHRLTPPPDEAYSLHRKLSGAFLGCMKLGAVVPCREMLYQVYEQYEFVDDHCAKKVSGSSTS